MRINIYSKAAPIEGKKIGKGGTLTDYLILVQDPMVADEAATKSYVDNLFTNLSVVAFQSGTLRPQNMPALSGDVLTTAGSIVTTLKPLVNAGVYITPRVNAKGLVTGGGGMDDDAFPNLHWDKVKTGKPSSVEGYGIGDAVSQSGGTINVNMTLHADPTLPNHAVTKGYADTRSSGGASVGLEVGDIVLKTVVNTPSGFLQCTGGTVAKTTYPALFAAIANTYEVNSTRGGGKPWNQQNQINPGGVISFGYPTYGAALVTPRANAQVVVTNRKIYLLGGEVGVEGGAANAIQYAEIGGDGSIGAWANYPISLPVTLSSFQTLVINNFLYVIAGYYSGNVTRMVHRSPIGPNGELGPWISQGEIPMEAVNFQCFATPRKLYIVGGLRNSFNTGSSGTGSFTMNPDGSLGVFQKEVELPADSMNSSIAVVKDKVYLLGGEVGYPTNGIYRGNIDATGSVSSWSIVGTLPASVAKGNTLVTDTHLYYCGGKVAGVASPPSTSIYRCEINQDGSLNNWITLPGEYKPRSGNLISIKNRIVVIGGEIYDAAEATGVRKVGSVISYMTNNPGAPVDFSPYYSDSVFTATPAGHFRLPNLNKDPRPEALYFIKF